MEPLAVDLMLLRATLGAELKIAPGRALMARVVAAEAGHGTLSIAGQMLDAKLPAHVRAGEELRLVVREVSEDKVVLGLADQQPPVAAPVQVPLPGGGRVAVTEREQSGGAEDHGRDVHVLTIRYDAPALGAVELSFALDPASLRLAVTLPAGEPFEHASDAAGGLRQALAGVIERTVTVTVTPRREPVDLYA